MAHQKSDGFLWPPSRFYVDSDTLSGLKKTTTLEDGSRKYTRKVDMSFPKVRNTCRVATFAAFLLVLGCGSSQAPPPPENDTMSAEEHEMKALELVEDRSFDQATVHYEAALEMEASPRRQLGYCHVKYMKGDYEAAVNGYKAYLTSNPSLPEAQVETLGAEIMRIQSAIDEGEEPVGKSLAGQWLRGRLAGMRAELDVEREDWGKAYDNYDRAFQYTGDHEMLFEAAMAASMGERWTEASRKYSQYLAVSVDGIPADRAYQVQAEIDRLDSVMKGEEPVTWETLAQQVYEERTGRRAPLDEPPSMIEERISLTVDGGVAADEEPEIDVAESEVEPEMTPKQRKKAEREARLAEKRAEAKAAKEARLAKQREAREKKKAEKEARLARQKEERERKKAEKEARLAKQKEERERKKAEKEARLAKQKEERERKKAEAEAKNAVKEASEGDGGYEEVKSNDNPAMSAALVPPERKAPVKKVEKRREVTLEDLLFYSKSSSSSVRMKAVKDLIVVNNPRVRLALEERVVNDTNMHVRFAAINGLAARRSRASVPVLRRATITATTSQERAVLKKAIDKILGISY